jgi:hypothetical protein
MARKQLVSATVCGHEVMGRTKTEAKQQAEREVTELVAHQHDRVYRFGHDGSLWCLYFAIGGWTYDIFRQGYRHASSCCMAGSKSDVLAAMERHIASEAPAQSDPGIYVSEHDSNGMA